MKIQNNSINSNLYNVNVSAKRQNFGAAKDINLKYIYNEHFDLLPKRIQTAVAELVKAGKFDFITLLDLHKEKYAPLLDCKTLDEARILFPEFREVLDAEMLKNDKHWKKHYHGTDAEIALKRKYSFSDRSRYYYTTDAVNAAIDTLLDNLKDGCPLNLLSQFMPIQYTKVREGVLKNDPKELVLDRIGNTIDEYLYATHQKDLF